MENKVTTSKKSKRTVKSPRKVVRKETVAVDPSPPPCKRCDSETVFTAGIGYRWYYCNKCQLQQKIH